MQKTIIALAVAGLSFNAAAVDFTVSPIAPAKYASEIVLPGLVKSAGNHNVSVALGAEIVAGGASSADKRYVRFDFGNAELATTLNDTSLSVPASAVGTPSIPAVKLVAGGTAGLAYAVFSVANDAAVGQNAIAADTKAVLATGDLFVKADNVTVSYKLYSDVTSATTGSDVPAQFASASKSGALIEFTKGLEVTAAAAGTKKDIDVTEASKLFVDTTAAAKKTNSFAAVTVKPVASVFDKEGVAVTVPNLLSTAQLVVNGDFSAGVKKADGTLDFAQALTVAGATANAANSTPTAVAFDITPVAALTAAAVTFNVDGETELFNQQVAAEFKPTAAAGYAVDAVSLNLGEIKRNAQEADVKLALNSNSSFNQFVRVINNSGVDKGVVKFTLKDDAGVTSTIDLSAIAGFEGTIAKGGALKPINVKDLFAAAKAKNAELSDKGMLRISVYGEVGATMEVQSYVVGADGSAFGTTY